MRALLVAVGAFVGLIGAVWILQGAGLLLGSFMSNDPTWFWIGVATAGLGLVLVAVGLRLPGRAKGTEPV